MALVVADRVKETTTTTGTGTLTLAGAVSGFQPFTAIGDGNETYYCIAHTTLSEWEVGVGTYTSSGTTLSRTTVLSSSNSGSLVNFSAGTKEVFVTYPAGRSVWKDTANEFNLEPGTATIPPLVFTTGTNLTTAVAGAMEYDGKVPYLTPNETQRGVMPGMQYYRLGSNLARANISGAQSFLGVGVTLSSSTVYKFEYTIAMDKTTGATTNNVSLLFGGTATLNNINYFAQFKYNTTSFTSTPSTDPYSILSQTAAASTILTGITASISNIAIFCTGTVSVNAGGTFIPQYSLSAAAGGAYTVRLGSDFLIYPVGASGSDINIGTWA